MTKMCYNCPAYKPRVLVEDVGKCVHPDSEYYQREVNWNDTCDHHGQYEPAIDARWVAGGLSDAARG